MLIVGIDLAWKSQTNPTALVAGRLSARTLTLERFVGDLYGVDAIVSVLAEFSDVRGIAIDGPLVITNEKGQRKCETLVGQAYGGKGASCHTSNLSLYPKAESCLLANVLLSQGFVHLGSQTGRWQLECYPHPALIEIFGLAQRHAYKKGRVSARRRGQCELAKFLLKLADSKVLRLIVPAELSLCMNPLHIASLGGITLKRNEDFLDAIVCAYIGALYASGLVSKVFGDTTDGYIYVPQKLCA